MAKPKTPEHLQRCEDAAAKLLQGKKKISHADVLRTFRSIKAADWPTQNAAERRADGEPRGHGPRFGVEPEPPGRLLHRAGVAAAVPASMAWITRRVVTKVVTKWIRDKRYVTGRRLPLRFDPSELQLSREETHRLEQPGTVLYCCIGQLRGRPALDGRSRSVGL